MERLRTFDGQVRDVDAHLKRFSEGAKQLGISWPPRSTDWSGLISELIDRNHELLRQQEDVGIVLLMSPGDPGLAHRGPMHPSVMAHLVPLPIFPIGLLV